jgi:hypothetical protein
MMVPLGADGETDVVVRHRIGRRLGLACLAFLLLISCGSSNEGPAGGGTPALLVFEADDELDDYLVEALSAYLKTITGESPRVERLSAGTSTDVERLAESAGAGLVFVANAHRLANDIVEANRVAALEGQNFLLITKDVGNWANALGSQGATIVYSAGNDSLARQYAAYEYVRRFGVRFFHPEEEYVPNVPKGELRRLAALPTVVARRDASGQAQDEYTADFSSRSYSYHGAHPLEPLESFSDASHPIDEAKHVNEWMIKNRGNLMRGTMGGVASDENYSKRAAELETLRKFWGFPRSSGIRFHDQQQGGTGGVVDKNGSTPVKQQIEEFVAKRLEGVPDAYSFGMGFGPTEFTVTPDKETVDWLNWAGQAALAIKPDIQVLINIHITGSQPTENYDDLGCPGGINKDSRGDYYDLAFHTDSRFALKVHTVMFYPLEGPANVYNQKTFSHKLCLMQKASAAGRPIDYFPEGSWWLSFDNPIPVYLPIYIWSRGRDIELLKPLLKSRGTGTLKGHRMFNSGQEWGYWQQDYAVGLWHWNADVSFAEVLGEMFDPFCAAEELGKGCEARSEAVTVMTEYMAHQRKYFLNKEDYRGVAGGIFAYFSGEDPAEEIGAKTGLSFQLVRVAFSEVNRWSQIQLDHFKATDLAVLKKMEDDHAAWLGRLEALKSKIPSAGKTWLAEVIDGIEINLLRARQTHALYSAVIAYREAILAAGDDLEKGAAAGTLAAQADWERAVQTLSDAEVVIRRREGAYRYPAAQVYGGGVTPETAVPNGTTYPWRVHTKTHLLSYWKNRHEQVKGLLAGTTASPLEFSVSPVFAAADKALNFHWPQSEDISVTASLDGQPVAVGTESTDLGASAGYWPIDVDIEVNGASEKFAGGVVRSATIATTPMEGFSLSQPESSLAQNVLKTVFPALQWAWLAGEKPALVFSHLQGNGQARYSDVIHTEVIETQEGFSTSTLAFTLPITDPSTGSPVADMSLTNVVISGKSSLDSPLVMTGDIALSDLVAALVKMAGFEETGAVAMLSALLGFDPLDPPSTIAFSGSATLQ